ncbi:conserved hypothetical protein [Vibrio crassostreae]|nr:conserved hypothetical protein [Vibrio crassostreae]
MKNMNIFEKLQHLNVCQTRIIELYVMKINLLENKSNDEKEINMIEEEIQRWNEALKKIKKDLELD